MPGEVRRRVTSLCSRPSRAHNSSGATRAPLCQSAQRALLAGSRPRRFGTPSGQAAALGGLGRRRGCGWVFQWRRRINNGDKHMQNKKENFASRRQSDVTRVLLCSPSTTCTGLFDGLNRYQAAATLTIQDQISTVRPPLPEQRGAVIGSSQVHQEEAAGAEALPLVRIHTPVAHSVQ